MAARVTQVIVEVLRSSSVGGLPVHAATTLTLDGTIASATNPSRGVFAATTLVVGGSGHGGGDMQVAATHTLQLSSNPGHASNDHVYVSATTTLTFSQAGRHTPPRPIDAIPSLVRFADLALATTGPGPRVIPVAATTALFFVSLGDGRPARIFPVNAITSLGLSARNTPLVFGLRRASVASGVRLSAVASAVRLGLAGAFTTIAIGQSATSGRDIHVAATTSVNLSELQGSNDFLYGDATGGFTFAYEASSVQGGKLAASGFAMHGQADASILLPAGGGVPGGVSRGMRTVLLTDISGEFPNSYAETPSGLILIANGIDPIRKWDGVATLAETAGVIPPATAIGFGGTGVGTITGRRVAYLRYVDKRGNFSNLSPVSAELDFGSDALIDAVTYDSATGRVTILSRSHGRSTGDPIIIEDVEGVPIVNGQHVITRVDADSFTLNDCVLTGGRYTQGGRWVYGIGVLSYTSVPTPAEAKVERRQILRNLDGNTETFYVDIDTTDLESSEFASTKSDEDLAAGQPVPLVTIEETPYANRYGVPPSHKALIASHLGRIFAAGDVGYTKGNCQPIFGQKTILGVGTAWRRSMVGRVIYMVGAANIYEIAAVDEDAQAITTTETIRDSLSIFTSYSIRPPAGERRFVYFTEPGLPEAWPPWNAISLPETSDEITGLMVKSSFLYILEKRHISKFTFQTDPARDGFVFLTTRRGCVNNRCHVQVEDTAYMLDEVGLHKFDGQASEPISTPIQNLFQQIGIGGLQVNWNADQRYWHAAHDPVRDTIRWFVAMTGSMYPRHAICYDYRRDRFWIEEYPFAITSSTIGTIGYRRSIAGSEARRVLCLGEGSLDAVDVGNGFRGNVTSAGPLSLIDSSASFPSNLAGAPVSIASGKGVGQQRKIAANTADTLRIDRPWLERPDATSVYQIGGVNWTWQSGWFRYVDQELENSRDVELIFQPIKSQSSANMRLYFDHDDAPRNWSRSIDQDGVSTIDGQPEITVDMTHRTGYAAHRQTGHRDPLAQGDRYVSVELSGVQSSEPHRVYQITLNGVHQA